MKLDLEAVESALIAFDNDDDDASALAMAEMLKLTLAAFREAHTALRACVAAQPPCDSTFTRFSCMTGNHTDVCKASAQAAYVISKCRVV